MLYKCMHKYCNTTEYRHDNNITYDSRSYIDTLYVYMNMVYGIDLLTNCQQYNSVKSKIF